MFSFSPYFLFLLYIGFLFTIVVIVVVFLFRKMLMRRGMIARSLNLELLLVRFTPEEPNDKNSQLQQIREKIALMEQFYTSLYAIKDKWVRALFYGKPVFALELTIPHEGEEVSFYVAVPRKLTSAAEKIIQGIFPEAQIARTRDYNVFNPEGAAVGATVTFSQDLFYPVRTYQKLEGDPMKAVTNVFTKLAKVGEGAALQIIARPAGRKWRRKLRDHAKRRYEGRHVSRDAASKIVYGIDDVLRSSANEQERRERLQDQKRLTPLQEEIVKGLEQKAGKALFDVNIRLVASADTLERAESILQGLGVAFEQFSDPNSNTFKITRVSGRALKRMFFAFSFRMFSDAEKMVLGTEELTSVFHFPNVPIQTPKMRIAKARESAPPANLPGEGLLLGFSDFRGEKAEIRILDEDRRRHLYAIGQTGTGKSVFLENMVIQDIQNGKGVCVIDPHGDMAERLLGHVPRHRWQDVVYFNPGDVERPMGLNMLEYDQNFPEQKTFVVNELLSIFQKLYGAVPESMGPAFEQYFRNSTLLVMEHPASGNTMLEISRVLSDKTYRDYKLAHCKNPIVRQFWQNAERASGEQALANFVPYVTNKFDNFTANEIMRPIIAQEKSAFNFREIMDNQKILIVNLSKGRLGDMNSSLIGLIIVGKLLISALSRVDMDEEKRKDFYLYIDEFQNVTTDSIAIILSEARKYRLDLTITHQFIGQLKEEIKKAVFGNIGSMIAFRVGADDAEFMAKQFKPVFAEQDLMNIDNKNCYAKLLIAGETTPPFNMKTYPPVKGEAEITATIKEISRAKYGRPRDEVEREIVERSEKVPL
ncbi:MAG: hypothetical protein G01um101433_713 [Parcubacteria group bacterium Gr01-1014_33]|nr:MAG: hypothetical protein G01um101433_713 [Parcubacteria group bacterium Gr01-1014_33]